MQTLFYSVSCIVFICGIHSIFKTQWASLIVYVLLLFNPISFAWQTFQYINRLGLPVAQSLLILGCFFAIYLRRDYPAKSLIGWSIGAGFGLCTLFLNREDGIWIMPFVLVATILLLFHCLSKSTRNFRIGNLKIPKINWKNCHYRHAIIAIVPLIMLFCATTLLSTINYAVYGVYVTCEMTDGSFPDFIHALYSVEPEEEVVPPWDVTLEELYMICEVSPTLASIESELTESFNAWSASGLISDDMIAWPIRDAVANAGHYKDAPTADAFYKQATYEINQALTDGALQHRTTLPSAMLPPWHSEYWIHLPKQMLHDLKSVISFEDSMDGSLVSAQVLPGAPNDTAEVDAIREWEAFTGNAAVNPAYTNGDPMVEGKTEYVNRVNMFSRIYHYLFPFIAVLGSLSIVLLLICFFHWAKKRKYANPYSTPLLIIFGILGSLLVFVGGVSYHTVTGSHSSVHYLAPAYGMIVPLFSIPTMLIIERLISNRRSSHTRKNMDAPQPRM